ncbi:MAG: hypothetical protein AABY22_28565 [Nanoarchaeota archaeon]
MEIEKITTFGKERGRIIKDGDSLIYETTRGPSNYFKKYQGHNFHTSILEELVRKHVDKVRLVYEGTRRRLILECDLKTIFSKGIKFNSETFGHQLVLREQDFVLSDVSSSTFSSMNKSIKDYL